MTIMKKLNKILLNNGWNKKYYLQIHKNVNKLHQNLREKKAVLRGTFTTMIAYTTEKK